MPDKNTLVYSCYGVFKYNRNPAFLFASLNTTYQSLNHFVLSKK